MAARRSAGEAALSPTRIAARACSSAALARALVSLASAASIAGSALASRDLNTASAASMRFCGSGLASVSEPIAASIAARSPLLTRTFLKARGVDAGELLVGARVDDVAARRLIEQQMIGGVDQQAAVAERVEDRRGVGGAAHGEFADRLGGLRKLVLLEPRQRVVERVRAGRRSAQMANRRTATSERTMLGIASCSWFASRSATLRDSSYSHVRLPSRSPEAAEGKGRGRKRPTLSRLT